MKLTDKEVIELVDKVCEEYCEGGIRWCLEQYYLDLGENEDNAYNLAMNISEQHSAIHLEHYCGVKKKEIFFISQKFNYDGDDRIWRFLTSGFDLYELIEGASFTILDQELDVNEYVGDFHDKEDIPNDLIKQAYKLIENEVRKTK